MGMRPDIHSSAQQKFGRPHLIKENKWPDHLSLRGWQRPPHGETTQVPRAGDDDHVNRVTGECVTRLRIDGRLPAHVDPKTKRMRYASERQLLVVGFLRAGWSIF